MYTADGRFCECVVIENDGLNTSIDFQPIENYDELKVEEFVPYAKKMGLVGMGGAGFPLHAKLKGENPPLDECIINGAECEPFLTCDHRIMLEKDN